MLLDRMQITQARVFLVNRPLLPYRYFVGCEFLNTI